MEEKEIIYYFRGSKVSWQGPGIYAYYHQQISWLSTWDRLESMEEIYKEIGRKPESYVVILHEHNLDKISSEDEKTNRPSYCPHSQIKCQCSAYQWENYGCKA